ncbi:hypothetical protein [Bavariicoccus seileri]|uniref:hypothetical protein n=1 Tax=Bavariicoccus seileri TaxID=549685 RepID=UPI0003B3C2EE|nr:hypothetical protein [Bavariicoccus seileri]
MSSRLINQQLWSNRTLGGNIRFVANDFVDEPAQDDSFWLSRIFYSSVCYAISALLFFLIFHSLLLETETSAGLLYLAIYLSCTIIGGYVATVVVGNTVIKKAEQQHQKNK